MTDDLLYAIKAYTAQGGQYAQKYPFTYTDRKLLYDAASTTRFRVTTDLYRKIDLSQDQYEAEFNNLYNYDYVDVMFNSLQSFTADRHRAFTYGGTHQQYILYVIPAGSIVNGIDIQEYSIYPEEQEVLLGRNTFKVSYDELLWTSTDNMIWTLRSSER